MNNFFIVFKVPCTTGITSNNKRKKVKNKQKQTNKDHVLSKGVLFLGSFLRLIQYRSSDCYFQVHDFAFKAERTNIDYFKTFQKGFLFMQDYSSSNNKGTAD